MDTEFETLIDDLKAIITEKIFISNWSKVECYHEVGCTIIESGHGDADIENISKALKVSKRTLQRSVQFARKFPMLEELPDGKNTTWHKLCNKYLPEPKGVAPTLPPFEQLKEMVLEHAVFLAETATAKPNGVELFLPKDLF